MDKVFCGRDSPVSSVWTGGIIFVIAKKKDDTISCDDVKYII